MYWIWNLWKKVLMYWNSLKFFSFQINLCGFSYQLSERIIFIGSNTCYRQASYESIEIFFIKSDRFHISWQNHVYFSSGWVVEMLSWIWVWFWTVDMVNKTYIVLQWFLFFFSVLSYLTQKQCQQDNFSIFIMICIFFYAFNILNRKII